MKLKLSTTKLRKREEKTAQNRQSWRAVILTICLQMNQCKMFFKAIKYEPTGTSH